MKTTLLLLFASLSLDASEFPTPYNSERDKSQPMSATEAAARMKLPPGFKATVFAAEPDVQNPIAMVWDARGQLWVVENYTYAEPGKKFDLNLRDRIPLRGTMWRCHPQRKVVEALSSGTTNRGAWLNSVHKRKLVRLEKRVRVFLPR